MDSVWGITDDLLNEAREHAPVGAKYLYGVKVARDGATATAYWFMPHGTVQSTWRLKSASRPFVDEVEYVGAAEFDRHLKESTVRWRGLLDRLAT